MQHSHCSYCGTRYPVQLPWPRTCAGCGETTWSNPLPVAVVLLPVVGLDGGTGLVVIRRDIEPGRGQLALPGGFIETGESWKQAAIRELLEETGIPAEVADISLFDVGSSASGYSLSIFALLPERGLHELPTSTPTAEATEWIVLAEPTRLAFPTHTEAMAAFFAGRRAVVR